MILTDDEIKAIDPVAWMNAKRDMTFTHGPYNADDIPLYEHPIPHADVVRDAERYRWLVDNSYDRDGFLQFQVWKHSWEPHSQTGVPIEWKCRVRGPAIDAAIDAAMKEMK